VATPAAADALLSSAREEEGRTLLSEARSAGASAVAAVPDGEDGRGGYRGGLTLSLAVAATGLELEAEEGMVDAGAGGGGGGGSEVEDDATVPRPRCRRPSASMMTTRTEQEELERIGESGMETERVGGRRRR
jgi:hypothetical protein